MELEQDTPGTEPEAQEASEAAAPESEAEDSSPSSELPSRSVNENRGDARESEARYWREEAERNRRQLDELQSSYRNQPQESDEQLRERLGPEGYILHQFDRQTNAFRQQSYAGEVRTQTQIDQLKFEREIESTARNLNWSAAKTTRLSSEIEQWYGNIARNAMQMGQPLLVTRVDLLDKLMGQEMRTEGVKAVRGASDKGRQNIARQSAKMTNASSNVSGKSAGKTAAETSLQKLIDAGLVEM